MKRIAPLSAFVLIFSCSDSNSPSSYTTPSLFFNEVYISDDPGWVEFYNPTDAIVDFTGFSLTDNENSPLYIFGDAQIQPRSYLTVSISSKNSGMNLMNGSYAWSWADSELEDDPKGPGGSTAEYTFSESEGLTGKLVVVNNSSSLGWSSTEVMLHLNGKSLADVNQILLKGYVSKNSKLEVRLAQTNLDGWQSWPAVITGTGQQNDVYTLNIPQGTKFPDMSKILGLRFSNTSNVYGTIDFSFNSIIAKKKLDLHANFNLKKGGGKLFLLDQNNNVKDYVSYPAGIKGLSYAKINGKWMLSKPPTPGAENSDDTYAEQPKPPDESVLPKSGRYEAGTKITLPQDIYCDNTGALPTENSSLKPGSEINLSKTTILRCSRITSGAYPSKAITRTYIVGRVPNLPIVSIVVNPKDMFDKTVGLYEKGPNAESKEPYYGANYHSNKELPIHLDFFENGASHKWSYPAGIRIMGGWSRMNPKKSVVVTFRGDYGQKNLQYPLFPEYPRLTKFKHFILRNNGNNYPNDYIRDMLMTSLTEGLGIDYQKGRAAVVYYNGEYWGIHNLRERSNSDYYETNYGIDENYIDLVKAGGEVSQGSGADYESIMSWLNGITSLSNTDLKTLEGRIDVDNFTNHFQSRIFYNDRDWPGNNMKMWRSNSLQSKWKFFMYDTDHGFDSYGKNTCPDIGMLTLVIDPSEAECEKKDWPNPEKSTRILRKLLTNDNYRYAFINRFSLLIATYFSKERVNARIDALMAPIQTEITYDQAKWGKKDPEYDLSTIRNFANTRPDKMQTEIKEFFELSTPVDITIKGYTHVDGLRIPSFAGSSVTFKAYPGVPMVLKWNGGEKKIDVPLSGGTFTAGQ